MKRQILPSQSKTTKEQFLSTAYLKEYFLEIVRNNSSYSLRAFAKKISITPSGLSQIFSGKSGISYERAHDFSIRLGLPPSETEYFLLLVQLDAAKNPQLKNQILEQLQAKFPQKVGSHSLSIDHFKMISEWYGLAILRLVSSFGSKWNEERISEYLNLHKNEVELMLARLERLELIERTQAGWNRVTDRVLIESQTPSDAIRSFYKNCLTKVQESIETQLPNEKVIGAEYISIDPSQIKEIEAATEEYFQKVIKIAHQSKKPTEIYQVFVNVYRMNQKKKEKIK